jgi:hypothetical protein
MTMKILLGCSLALVGGAFTWTCGITQAKDLIDGQLICASPQEEEEARNAQAAAQRRAAEDAQRGQQRQMEEQQRAQQQQQERQVQEQQRAQQQQQQRQVQEAQKAQQQQQQRQMQEAQKAQQRQIQEQQRNQQQALERQAQESSQRNQQREVQENQANQARMEERQTRERPANVPAGTPGFSGHGHAPIAGFAAQRASAPPPLSVRPVSIKTAAPPPYIAPNVTGVQRQQALAATQNLQAHLMPVPMAQAPQNMPNIMNQQLAGYMNNYPYNFNGQNYWVNRENTFVNAVGPGYYPPWWNPQPGWRFCNGFTFASLAMPNTGWLQNGWEPYWGPPPQGFVCADNYVPTPWIYIPAMNAWRQPGYPGFAEYGPPLDYTGPITVQITNPVRTVVTDPSGYPHREWMNQLYFYNAYFFPDYERWGYSNNQGYFVWLNI